MFTIYDDKALTFGQPFFQLRTEMAIRMFTDLVNNPEAPHGKHPKDYHLYENGEFNTRTGVVQTMDPPHSIISGIQVLLPLEGQADLLTDLEQKSNVSDLK